MSVHPEYLMTGPYGTVPTNCASRGGSKIYNKAALRGFGGYDSAALKGFGNVYNKAAIRGFGLDPKTQAMYNNALMRGFGNVYNKAALRGFGTYSSAINPSACLIDAVYGGGGGKRRGKGRKKPVKKPTRIEKLKEKQIREAEKAAAEAAEQAAITNPEAAPQVAAEAAAEAVADASKPPPTAQEAQNELKKLGEFAHNVGVHPSYLIDHADETLHYAQLYGPSVVKFLKKSFKTISRWFRHYKERKQAKKMKKVADIAQEQWDAQQDAAFQPVTTLPSEGDAVVEEEPVVLPTVAAEPVDVSGEGWFY